MNNSRSMLFLSCTLLLSFAGSTIYGMDSDSDSDSDRGSGSGSGSGEKQKNDKSSSTNLNNNQLYKKLAEIANQKFYGSIIFRVNKIQNPKEGKNLLNVIEGNAVEKYNNCQSAIDQLNLAAAVKLQGLAELVGYAVDKSTDKDHIFTKAFNNGRMSFRFNSVHKGALTCYNGSLSGKQHRFRPRTESAVFVIEQTLTRLLLEETTPGQYVSEKADILPEWATPIAKETFHLLKTHFVWDVCIKRAIYKWNNWPLADTD